MHKIADMVERQTEYNLTKATKIKFYRPILCRIADAVAE